MGALMIVLLRLTWTWLSAARACVICAAADCAAALAWAAAAWQLRSLLRRHEPVRSGPGVLRGPVTGR